METVKTQIAVRSYTNLSQRQKTELRTIWLHATATDTHAIGWLPAAAYDARAQTNDLITIENNGDCVGWSMTGHSKHRGILKLYQIWVRPDARILEHGRALIAELRRIGGRKFCYQIEAWVAEDLPANLFWHAIGFTRSVWRYGRGPRPRKHWLWTTQTANVCVELPKISVVSHAQSGEKE